MTYPHPDCMVPDGGEGPCAGYRALEAERNHVLAENTEMRRTFGSHPLFEEKDAEIASLRAALNGLLEVEDYGHAFEVRAEKFAAARAAVAKSKS